MKNIAALCVCALAGLANAGLVQHIIDTTPGGATVDGSISGGEYGGGTYFFTGGGNRFGGTLGNGRIYMDSSASDLYIGLQAGANLNDNVVIFIDSRSGGFLDADMNDTADPGRNLSSNLTRDVNDTFDAAFVPDFSVVIGAFGIVVFELTNSSHNFQIYSGTFTGNDPSIVREISIPLSNFALSAGSTFKFFAAYGSDTNFMSNETIPAMSVNDGENPGFGDGLNSVHWENYNAFTVVPAPASLALVGLGGLFAGRRRR